MFLQDKQRGIMVEVLEPANLFNPVEQSIQVRGQEGQEEQLAESVEKHNLIFPSGENLPRCWVDANYRTN